MTSNIKILLSLPLSVIIMFLSSCDKDITIITLEEEIPKAFLYVTSSPSGSAIYLNNKNTGRTTPGLVPFLEDGNYQVTLKRKYFRDTTFTVILTQFDTSKVAVDYFHNPTMLGKIKFTSSPANVDIVLNDSLTNLKTPTTLNGLLPGNYKVKYRYYNHRESLLDVVVESNKISTAYALLRDTSQWVDFQLNNSEIQSVLLTSIVVDNQNTKWIGTFDKGIIKYDEQSFVNYNSGNSILPSNQINFICVDANDKIWIGTNNGLITHKSGDWEVFNTTNSELPNNNINCITFDVEGNCWIGTNNGFARFDGINWQVFNYSSLNFEYLWVTSLKLDVQNNLWIGSNNFGILKFYQNQFIEYVKSEYNFLSNRISAIGIDNSNNVWFGQMMSGSSRGGISIFDGNGFNNLYLGTSNNKVNNIYMNGTMKWVCTSEGITFYNEGNLSTFYTTINSKISSDNITGIVKDLNGYYWITTYGGGLNKLKYY